MAVPVVASAEAGVPKLPFPRSCVVTHAQRLTQHAPSVSCSSLWAGLCLLNQHSVTQTDPLCFGCPTELFWDAGKELSLPLSCFACLQPSVLKSLSQKHPLPPASSKNPIHHSEEKKNLAMDFLHRAWLRPIMVCVLFQVQNPAND